MNEREQTSNEYEIIKGWPLVLKRYKVVVIEPNQPARIIARNCGIDTAQVIKKILVKNTVK